MDASFPSRRWTPALVAAGCLSVAATVAVFVRAFPGDAASLIFAAPSTGAVVAGLAALRSRPDLVAARRLLAFGVCASVWMSSIVALVVWSDRLGHRWWLVPGNVAVQVLGLAMWAAVIALLVAYPDGMYRRPHQRVLARAAPAIAVALPLAVLVAQRTVRPAWAFAWGEGTTFPRVNSPLHVPALAFLASPLGSILDAALVAGPLLSAVVIWLRYRSLPAERKIALRWPLYGAAAVLVAPLALAADAAGAISDATARVLQPAALLALPASLAVGIVRPDLFDVDRAMRRSVAYVALWTLIAAAYVGAAAALGLAAPGEGIQLSIAATIGATLLFGPARRHLATRAARWAYGETVSGADLIRRLGQALEHTLDEDQLRSTVAAIAREGLGATWVRVSAHDRPPAVSGAVTGPAATSAPLVTADGAIGTIECGPPEHPRSRRSVEDHALLDSLARQAALAVQNARLVAEVRERLGQIQDATRELAASRSRIVAAHETARRQIERDIHDGAQQDLVALIAGIGVARQQAVRDGGSVDATLVAIQAQATRALDDLRRLAAGIHPSVLSDHGLVEALEIRSSRLPVDVTIDCEPDLRRARFDDAVEGTAYFFVTEALANTLKHSGATHASVTIARCDGELVITVSDSGSGFDATTARGTGLRGMADRVEAHGGTVQVTASPGTGTTLTMRLPL